MAYYKIIGIGKDSKRKRTKRYKAKDESAARLMAESDGTLVENVEYEKPEPATERQISYAKDLGLSFPPDIDINEMSNLISKKVDEDRDAPSWLLDYVLNIFPEENNLTITKYIGIENLFSFLIGKYTNENNYKELVKILIYSIINEDRNFNWTKSFNDFGDVSVIDNISEILSQNQPVINSIKRYSVRDYVSLGELINDEGYESMGNIKRTNAYLITKKTLNEHNLIIASNSYTSDIKSSSIHNKNNRVKKDIVKKQGCFGSIIFIISIIILTIL